MISDDDKCRNSAKKYGSKACGSDSKNLDGAARVRPRVALPPKQCKMNVTFI